MVQGRGECKVVALLLFLFISCGDVYPDAATEIFVYQENKELSYIEISSKTIFGAVPAEYLEKNKKEYIKKGIYQEEWPGEKNTYVREAKIDGLKIKTILTMNPPLGYGYGGGSPTQNIQIYIDGRKKIDCSLGSNANRGIVVDRIVLHTTPQYGIVEILARTTDGKVLEVPFKNNWFKDDETITDDMLMETKNM